MASADFRISPQQRRLWQLQSTLGERPFRARALARVRGGLDLGLLRKAVDRVVGRYEVLRTTFPCPAGLTQPVQRVADQGSVTWHATLDLSGAGRAEAEATLGEILRTVAEEPFDFDRGPLLRLVPAVLPDCEHALVLVLPSLCADTVTLRNLVHQISASYAALAGAAPEPESSVIQYVDLAEWQIEILEQEETATGREHWERWDSAACRALHLPFEAERTGEDRFEPCSLPVPLESGLARRAAALAAEIGVPLPTLLLASWQSLLWRLLGQPEITVGLEMECRSYEGLSESLGPLASFVPLACRLDGDVCFADAVARVRNAEQATAKWQEYFRWESVARRQGLTLEQTVFPASFTAQGQAPWRAGLLDWALPLCEAGLDRFRLGLKVRVEGGLPAVELAWDAAVVSRDDAEGLARSWRALLASAVARPEARLCELALAGPAEQLQFAWAETCAGGIVPALVHELFARQARRVPDRAAVVCSGRSLSYGELAERARRLSCLLRRHGVGPDVLVALCLERSLTLPLAVLGVLGAGGAYLPLEPRLPRERKSFLLNDARPRVVLTETRFLTDLPVAAGVPVLCLDGLWEEEETAETATGPVEPAPDPANLVYVIYTSGSTGAPKGVAVEHRQLANYIQGVTERLDLPDGAAYAMVSTFAADLGNTVLFPSLCSGGTLHLIPEELSTDPVALAAALERDPVDCLKITPSHLKALLAGAPSPRLLPRRCLVLGGEASHREWVEGLVALKPGMRVLNHYGPTETTVGVLTHQAAPGLRTATLPLGRPLPGTTARLLGEDLTPLPAWFYGEIHLGGAGVARGYLGRPDLTADRFVPDPRAGVPGARMYRTGDLARRLPDGTLEFIGRADNQVKVRGFRIELGEIEKVLEGDPEVRRAAVAVRNDGSGAPRLVAYVVAESRAAEDAAGFRERLLKRLPEFMVPSAFVFLDALPLNANGKLDRLALPEPDWLHLGGAEEYVAPETPAEKVLARVWSEVLGAERVGARDNFFLLGGDSIRGIVTRARAEEEGVIFSIEELFNHPDLRDLARVAGQRTAPASGQERTEPFALLTEADRARLPEGLEDAYPLAVLQAGMVFHSEVTEGTAIFHDLHSIHLRAPFDPDRMREAVRRVSLLHPVLRTSFDLTNFEEALQLVHGGLSVPLEVHDLSPLPPDEQEAAVLEWLSQERQRPFDWTRPPLVGFHVHLRGEGSFQFTMSFHHAILDGWSSAALLTELFRRYASSLRGEEPPSDVPLEVAYKDFVALERAALASGEARSFWSRMLDGAEPARLPRLSDGKAAPGPEIRRVQVPIDPVLSAGAQEAAREARVPLKSLLLAVFFRVLGALGGTTDVLAALVAHGRPEHTDGEKVLGLFLNTLPLRVRLRGGSWRDLAREVFDLERQMLPFRRFPFAEMQRMEGGRLGLEAAFNYMHYHVYQGTAGVREIEVLAGQDYEETNFPLLAHVSLDPASQNVGIGLNYRVSELDPREAERFADYLVRALTAVAADPASRYDTSLLSATERHQLLVEWNDRETAHPALCLHEMFELQAERCPEAVAVTAGGESLTYGELHRYASGVAHRLRSLGAGPETRIALCLERTPSLVAALLGTLAAGGAYLPLDPSHPRERLAFLLEDSEADLLLTERRLAAVLPAGGPPRIWLDEERDALAAAPAGFPAAAADPQNLAYVIYTSGSTGRPKGVQIPHSAVVNFLGSMAKAPGLTRSDALLAVTTLSFDIAGLEIFLPLAVGARIEIVPREIAVDGERLASLLRTGITAMQATPATWRMLLEAGWTGRPDLEILCGGEALPRDLADRLLAASGSLWNLYGPTETTIWSALERIAPGPGPITIGRPLDNTRLHLLAPDFGPVPTGALGELCIGGAGLARGYLGRPDLTAERFVCDPFAGLGREPGARLYRTGDLARRLADGRIEFLGRTDFQVKIRGVRVEPGEIEAALRAHPAVRQAVVLARSGPAPGEVRLVAYLVGTDPAGLPAAAELRDFLRERLPAAIVPADFVALDELPLTSSGKVDRQRLAAMEIRPAAGTGYVAPRNPVEERLAAIWAQLLRVERVGVHDNFFALGGDSIWTLQVTARARQAGLEMSPRLLFENPTVAGLAAAIERDLAAGARPEMPPIERSPYPPELPLSFGQQRLWLLAQLEPESPTYNIPLATLLTGRLRREALAASFEQVAARHESLRTTFDLAGEEPVQRIAPPGPVALPWIDLTALPGHRRDEEARALAREDALRPFDLRRGPLLRLTLVRLAQEENALLLNLHHIVADGWSLGILMHEVAAFYSAALAGRLAQPVLPPLPVQYADYTLWQRRFITPEALENEIRYWRERLAGAPLVLELPADRPRPAVPSGRGGVARRLVPASRMAAMASLARGEGATLFMALLATFGVLLHRYTGREDVVLGTDATKRDRVETQGLIGFFINQLVLRIGTRGEPSFSRLLEQVRATTLDAYDHQDLPFEKLVEALQPQRDLSRHPVFQVAFALQNMPTAQVELPGLSLSPLGAGSGSARLDLTVSATETGAGGLLVGTEHSSDLFDDTTAARLLGHLAALLEAAAATPEAPISELSLLPEAERQQALVEWNDSAAALPAGGSTFDALFAARAAAEPGRVAAVCGGERLTYGELAARADRLARRLAAEGVGPESVVALVADRGLGFLTAVLATFKAGAAYLPIDPLHPLQRQMELLTASGARRALASRLFAPGLAQPLAAAGGPRLFELEDLLEREDATAGPLPSGAPERLAYVIYTSGSTGVPKGAMIEQRGMLNHLWAKVDALGLDEGDAVAQTASQCFDISVWQLLAALLVGGRVHIFPDEVAHDPLRLLGEVDRAGVTVLETVPSLLRLMLDEIAVQPEAAPPLSRLRFMIPTGEALPPGLCRRWLALYPGIPLVNAYGPTECSDDVTHWTVRSAPDTRQAHVPIGRPVPNLRLYALGREMQPLPAGVPGELYVGGAGVGRGYLGDGGRTAAAWVPDPFAEVPGARLYRTGDLARRLADGRIEFLGRIDHQVKVRGHRIELGEIEAALTAHPSVRQAVVLAREDTPGDRRLVAYVVAGGDHQTEDAVKVGQWQTVFDEVYHQEAVSERDAAVHLRVWIDSYTGRPLPEDEIAECVEDSVARIRALSPVRVLEIGCGSGLLLERIAPGCAEYWATDISAEVLGSLERRLAGRPGLPPVRLLKRAADDFAGIPEAAFDTVILNEVVQYFPSGDYLAGVLDRALAAVAPGGSLFVGGVRSLPLLEAFAAGVEVRHLEEAGAGPLPLAAVRERIRRRVEQEKELLVAPELFDAVARRAGLGGAEIQLKGGRAHNELTRFRYDAVLRKAGPEGPDGEADLPWREVAALAELRRRLEAAPEEALCVRGIPNARLLGELAALALLYREADGSLGELREALDAARPDGVEPEDLWRLGRELGRQAEVRWDGDGGLLAVRFGRPGADLAPRRPAAPSLPASWSRWTNQPVRGLIAEGLVPHLRTHLAAQLPEPMIPAAFVLLEALPLAPNGKIDRRALPAPDQARPELDKDFVPPSGPVEEALARIWREVLRLDRIGVRDNFFHLGGDSILSIQVVSRANQEGLSLTPRQMFQYQTIAELASVAGTGQVAVAEQGIVTGEAVLAPIQHWFFDQGFAVPGRWNQGLLLETRERLDPAVLATALDRLLAHHDALRLRFRRAEGEGAGWRQVFSAPAGEPPLTVIDLGALPEGRRSPEVAALADLLHDGLDLAEGPVARAALYDLGDAPGRLQLVVHHLAMDGVSWRILLEDLQAACRALARGEAPALPAKTLSFKSWAERLAAHARSASALAERGFWLAAGQGRTGRLPVDHPGRANLNSSAAFLTVTLSSAETTALLQEVPRAYHTQIDDALLTALARTLARWTGERRVLVELERHGREDLFEETDLSRTVGWFTSQFPLLLELTRKGDPGEDLKAVKERLRALPRGGIGWGLLRYLGDRETSASLAALPGPEILFNYQGQLDAALPADSLFGPAREPSGLPQSRHERRTHLLEINGRIAGERLQLTWAYSRDLHNRSTIEEMAGHYITELRALIEHCRAPEAGGYTPSDFAGARMSQGDLDKLLGKLGKGSRTV